MSHKCQHQSIDPHLLALINLMGVGYGSGKFETRLVIIEILDILRSIIP